MLARQVRFPPKMEEERSLHNFLCAAAQECPLAYGHSDDDKAMSLLTISVFAGG
jgi:hypothetical protein